MHKIFTNQVKFDNGYDGSELQNHLTTRHRR